MEIVPFREELDDDLLALLLLADPDEQAVRSYFQRSDCLVAIAGEEKVGVALLAMDEGQFELKNIAVTPARQGAGVGKLLIEAVKDRGRALGAEDLQVGTGNSSLDELAFYQKSGFRMVGIKSGFFADYDPPIIENGIRCLDMVILLAKL